MKKNRRGFLKNALLSTGALTGFAAQTEPPKVKMLTADGELVEIDQKLLNQLKGPKVTNKEILDWSNKPKT